MKLDKEQEQAANCINENSIIIAGAGTGKTTTLIGKIEKMIKSGIKESEILVISFTNETVNNFKLKCKYKIDVYTFHKIAMIISCLDKEIVDGEQLIKDIAITLLSCIPINIKKTIFHYYCGRFCIFSDEKFDKVLQDNTYNSIIKDIQRIIICTKSNNIELDKINVYNFSKTENYIMYIIYKIYEIYTKELSENNFCDFDDIIINATNKLKNNEATHQYKYILVDEYQDISYIRLNFLKELVNASNCIITVVGDDFQSIYGFSGSDINIFLNFHRHFENVKTFIISNTYRCPQIIVNKAGKFIMKNNQQIKKELKSLNKKRNVIHKVYYNDRKKVFYKILHKIVNTKKTVMILSRNNYDINNYIYSDIKFENSYLTFNNVKFENIRYMSVHSSKGLEADIIILLNLTNSENGFPSKKKSKLFEKTFTHKEKYKYAEERRLFYVALTRCKEEIYLIIDQNNPSKFALEV
jgi:DNA helicase-4